MTLIFPRPLPPRANVRIVSPAWPAIFYAPQRMHRAERALQGLGLRVSYGKYAAEITDDGYSAGTAEQRAADFMNAVIDPGVDAIFSAGGGATTGDLLPLLDPVAIRNNPKPFIGHCNNVWLNHYLLQEAGLCSYYGVTFMAHFGEVGGIFPETASSFRRAVMGSAPLTCVPVASRTNEFFNWQDPAVEQTPRARNVAGGWHWLSPGAGRGPYLGAEVSDLPGLIKHFGMTLEGAVLFLETAPTNEMPMPDSLQLIAEHSDLSRLAGLVVGPDVRHTPDEWARIAARALADVVGETNYPILANADIGHLDPVWVVPYGTTAVLDSATGLSFLREAL